MNVIYSTGFVKCQFITKLKLLGEGLVTEAQEIDSIVADFLSSDSDDLTDEVKAVMIKEILDGYYQNIKKG
jgi:DNA polymerase III delta subunit